MLTIGSHGLDDGFCLEAILRAFSARIAVDLPAGSDDELVNGVAFRRWNENWYAGTVQKHRADRLVDQEVEES